MSRMRLVVDANVLLGAFLRDGVSRELLLHAPLDLYAPQWLRVEVQRNLLAIAERKNLNEPILGALLERIMGTIQEVPDAALAPRAAQALARCKKSGSKDAPYVACALAVDADVWTHDRTLAAEAGVRCISTSELKRKFVDDS